MSASRRPCSVPASVGGTTACRDRSRNGLVGGSIPFTRVPVRRAGSRELSPSRTTTTKQGRSRETRRDQLRLGSATLTSAATPSPSAATTYGSDTDDSLDPLLGLQAVGDPNRLSMPFTPRTRVARDERLLATCLARPGAANAVLRCSRFGSSMGGSAAVGSG